MATELRGQSTDQSIRALAVGEGPAVCGAHFSCHEAPSYLIIYVQKTGKALGNNTNHRAAHIKNVCATHGKAFAEKWNLDLPATPAAEDVAA